MLDPQEIQQLNTAYMNVMRHYPIHAAQKTIDWLNLIGAVSFVYGSRLIAIRARRSKEKNEVLIRTANPGDGAQAHMVQ